MTAYLTIPATTPVPPTPSQAISGSVGPIPSPTTPASPMPSAQVPLTLSDATEKVFLLFGRYGVGVYGDAFTNNMPVAHTIQDFEAKTSSAPSDPEHLADSLLRHLHAMNPVPNLGVTIIGYKNLDQWILSKAPLATAFTRVNISPQTQNIIHTAQWAGDTLVATRLFSDPNLHPPCSHMNVQDAIDLSRHIIRATIDQLRFEPRYATVGGPIDTLLITQSEARFIVHKALHADREGLR